MSNTFILEVFNPNSVDSVVWDALYELYQESRQEFDPTDPLLPKDYWIKEHKDRPGSHHDLPQRLHKHITAYGGRPNIDLACFAVKR